MASWLGLTWADWIVLAVYLVGVTALGVMAYRRVKDMTDFFMGGRRFGKIAMMFFAFGSGTSSEQAVSVVAGSFRVGLAGIWYQFLWLWATPFYWILAPILRRMRALTTADFFESRFDTSTATLYSIMGMGMSITFIAGALFASGKMVEGLTGGELDYNYTIAAMTIMFVLYGMAGGLGAAILTDLVQGILTITFSFLLLPFAMNLVGGLAGLHEGSPFRPDMLSLTIDPQTALREGTELIDPFYVLMISITALISIVVQPHIMGVCGAGKTEMEGRFGFTFGNFLKRFCTIAWTFTGLACILIYLTPERMSQFEHAGDQAVQQAQVDAIEAGLTPPDDDQRQRIRRLAVSAAEKDFADRVFGIAAHDILPTIAPGLVGLLLASLLAAVMSTCDAQMVVSSGLFTENIYKRFMVREQTPRHYLWVGRITGLVIVAMALILQTQFTDVIHALTDYILQVPAWIGIAFWIGMIWRGFTPAAVWTSTASAGIVWYLTGTHRSLFGVNLDYYPGLVRAWMADAAPLMMRSTSDSAGVEMFRTSVPWQMLSFLVIGTAAGILTSLVTRRPAKEKLDAFFRLMRTPIRSGEHVPGPCRLPVDAGPPVEKLFSHPDIEIPRPDKTDLIGFALAWLLVGLIVWFVWWLAQ